jgi:hypothetical protein
MAKLPRSPISVDVQTNYRPVREARASGADPVGGALQQVGNAGFEIATRMADAKIAADAAEASIRLRSRLDEESRAIENDMEGDPAGFEARFRERAAAIANEEAGKMSSPAMKRAFALKAQEQTETYSINMRDVTRRRQVEGVKAQTLKVGADYELLAQDPSKPRELLEQSRDDYLALIDRQQKAGIYTPDVAEAARIAANEVYRAGVTTRHLTNVDTMLDAGRYGEAEEYFKANYGEMDPAQREKAEQVLQTKTREGVAIQTADKLWTESGNDYGAAIAEAYKIENPDERLAVETRLAQLKNQGDAAREATDKALLEEGMGYITKGQGLPADLLRRASPLVVDRLQTEQRTRALWDQQMATSSAEQKAALKQISALSMDYLKIMAVNEGWRETYLSGPENWPEEVKAEYDRLSPEHKGDIQLDIATKRAAGGTLNAVEAVAADVIKQIPMYGPAGMTGKDFSFKSDSTGEALEEERAVLASVYRQAADYSKRSGGAPITPQESKVMIARAFRAANPAVYPYAPGDRPKSVAEAAREAMAIREDLRAVLGREPTQQEINQIAQELSR